MTRTYEAMFLLDNDSVRSGWRAAKGVVTGLVEKHGGKTVTARRWDERRLAYPIKGKRRATYLLTYCDLAEDAIPGLVRDLEINERVLRHLILRADSVPEAEHELSRAEDADDFSVPAPPEDDAVDVVEEPEPEAADERKAEAKSEGETKAEGDSKAEGAGAEPASESEAKADSDGAAAEKRTDEEG